MRKRVKRQPQQSNTCQPSDKGWFDYLNENMEELGLWAPDTLYKQAALSVGTLKSLEAAYAIFKGVGVTELASEGVYTASKAEGLTLAGAALASFYTGALIGSMAIASQRSMSCGKRLNEYFEMMPSAGFSKNEVIEIKSIINNHPAIMNPGLPNRKVFAIRARLTK